MKIYEKIAVLDNNLGTGNQKNLERAYYYDYMGRIVQVIEKNHLDGISINSTKYDYVGNILSFHESHQKSSGATPDIKLTNYTYDTRGRMLTESTTVNSQGTATISYTYDVLGKLTGKTYGNGATESLSYNIQGWLSSKSSAKSGTNLFSMNLLYYNSTRATNKYTGNIVEWQWTQGTGSQNSYALSYDKLSRLTNSNRYVAGVATNAFTEKNLTYDKNGNITQLQRYGSTGSLQDNFTYNYNGTTYNGNQLSSISGSVSATYAYDNNGNMTSDGRKNLAITYNVLNLQQTLSQSGTAVANYSWLADGTKCAVVDNTTNGFDYLGSLKYTRNGSTRTLESTDFGGGRIVYSGGTYTPYYYITDHLGSVRVITNNSGAIVEQNDYYPFGGKHANANYPQFSVNKQKFNGKELQTTGSTGFLDYGARMYDDVIGRWGVVDPLGEKYIGLSPFNFCANNPIKNIDFNGKDWYSYTEKYQDENGVEQERIQYKFSEEYRSQKDLDKAGIKGSYLGITYKTEAKYLSLLGEIRDTKDKNGSTNIETGIVEKLDNSIMNYYKQSYEEQFNVYKSEVYSITTNMSLPITSGREIPFQYASGSGVYSASDKNDKAVFSWGNGNMKQLTGFLVNRGFGINTFVESTNGRFNVLSWSFKNKSDYQKAKSLTEAIFKNRKL